MLQICYVDMSERHTFVCEQDAVHVFLRESSSKILRIPADATIWCTSSQLVEDPDFNMFTTHLSVSPNVDTSRPRFITGMFSYPLIHRAFLYSHLT
jgi:hypothetical protein